MYRVARPGLHRQVVPRSGSAVLRDSMGDAARVLQLARGCVHAGAGAGVRSAPWFQREQREADWVLLSHSHAPTIDTAPQSPPSHQALYRCSPGPTSCQAVGRESGWPAPLSLQHNQLPSPLILLGKSFFKCHHF